MVLFTHFSPDGYSHRRWQDLSYVLHLLKFTVEIPDLLSAFFRFLNFNSHATGDFVPKHPNLLAFAHQDNVHENSDSPVLRVSVIPKREKRMRRQRDISFVIGVLRESGRPFRILFHVIGIRRADIYQWRKAGFSPALIVLLKIALPSMLTPPVQSAAGFLRLSKDHKGKVCPSASSRYASRFSRHQW